MLVAGLGNPGGRYRATRHNLGFKVAELLAQRHGADAERSKHGGLLQEIRLPEGSTLLLFTDGLFERRGVPLDEGREGVRELLERSASLPLAELCDLMLAELVGPGAEDDVAVLAVRAHPVFGERPAEAGPESVPQMVDRPV